MFGFVGHARALGGPFVTVARFGLINRGETSPRASVAGRVARKLAARFAALLVLPTDCSA